VSAGFFIGNFMTNKTDKDTKESIDDIAERWVKLVLSQIEERKKVREKAVVGKN